MKFENLGPSECIASNIRSQLDGYKDGLALFKEMIQNADDAGAQVLKICYDKRNLDCSMWKKTLFTESPKLIEAQGRAIWFFNDARFKESDFENVAKLGGETKKDSPEKIGKFGRGFCSVYNVTDLPSILSGSSLAIFDPNIEALKKIIKDPSNPGIRVDLNDRKDMSEFYDQFKPYEGIFACDIYRKEFHFEGTLIRLPFRKTLSKISENIYHDDLEIIKLFEFLLKNADSILLFTQSVKEVQVYILEDIEMKVLFSLIVKQVEFLKVHPFGSSCLKEQSSILKASIEARSKNCPLVETSMLVQVSLKTHLNNLKNYLSWIKEEEKEFYWLINSSFSCRNLKLGKKGFENFLPCAGSAVKIEYRNKSELFVEEAKGAAFCFLPLSIDSGLKYHVNCTFALSSDRLRIVERTRDDRETLKSLWNDGLIDPILDNLILMLDSSFKRLKFSDPFEFVKLFWPLNCKDGFFERYEQRFYERFFSLGSQDAVFPSLKQNGKELELVKYERCVFAHFSFADSQINELSYQVIEEIINSSSFNIIRLPWEYLNKLKNIEKDDMKFIDEYRFLKLLLENKDKIEQSELGKLLATFIFEKCYDSKDQLTECGKFMKSNNSVPNRRFELCRPSLLVNPRLYPQFACLDFGELDQVFPAEIIAQSESCIFVLQKLGLMTHHLNDQVVVKIANTINKIGSFKKAQQTSELLIAYLSENKEIHDLEILKEIPWVLSKEKPNDWSFQWHGSNKSGFCIFFVIIS